MSSLQLLLQLAYAVFPWLGRAFCLYVMGTIRDALERPSGDSPLEPDIALQLSERPREFERRAAKFTREHATGGK